MRPRSLTLRAFGAFAGQHTVPFADLAELGLFTITGPTGSGKTTVFDAMAYALFGGVPGDRPTAEVRSHHAEPGSATEVRLEFEARGERWAVERRPEQSVMGARKVRRQIAEARLFQWLDGRWQGVETGPRRVDPRIAALVGLDLRQFERVVLLPQGRFQQFLLSGTKARQELLRHLFGAGVYQRVTDMLLVRAAELRDRVAAGEQALQQRLAEASDAIDEVRAAYGAPPLDLDGSTASLLAPALAGLLPEIEGRDDAMQALESELAAAQLAAQRATDLAERWRRRAAWRERQGAHDARRHEIVAASSKLEAAERAAPVGRAAAASATTRAALDDADDALARVRRRLARAAEQGGLRADAAPTVADVALASQAARAAAADLDAARQVAAAAASISARRDALDAEAQTVDRRQVELAVEVAELSGRASTLQGLAAQLPAREAEAARAEHLLRRRRSLDLAAERVEVTTAAAGAAREMLDQVTVRFVRGFAPRLAAALQPGDPCPVCGAVEHPAPAQGHPDATVTPADLEAAQARAQEAMAAQGQAVSDLHLINLELGDAAGKPVAEALAAAESAAAAADDCRTATAELRRDEHRLDELGRLTADCGRRRVELDVGRARIEEQAAANEIEARRLAPTVDGWAGVDVAARLDALERTQRLLVQTDGLERRALLAAERHADADAALTGALAASGMATVDEALAGVLAPEREARLRRAVHDWHADDTEIAAHLLVLEADGLPDDQPQPTDLVERAAALRARVVHERDAVLRMRHAHERGAAALAAAARAEADLAGQRADRELTETVARTCNGQGPGRVALESWVLATELEQVVSAANVHLGRMSAGRYQLVRTDDAGHAGRQAGLDLAVLDSHTGRQRPATTLSGGEQFQASLALALGLADVVGNTADASAAGFDALFVDEGFGSLDADALDLAIGALDELRGHGRMVVVVTHVEALKSALPVGVEVSPRPDGGGSTLSAGPVAAPT